MRGLILLALLFVAIPVAMAQTSSDDAVQRAYQQLQERQAAQKAASTQPATRPALSPQQQQRLIAELAADERTIKDLNDQIAELKQQLAQAIAQLPAGANNPSAGPKGVVKGMNRAQVFARLGKPDSDTTTPDHIEHLTWQITKTVPSSASALPAGTVVSEDEAHDNLFGALVRNPPTQTVETITVDMQGGSVIGYSDKTSGPQQ